MHTARILFTVALASLGVILGIAFQVARRIFQNKKFSDGNRAVVATKDSRHLVQKVRARRYVPQNHVDNVRLPSKEKGRSASTAFAPYGVLLQGVFLGVGIALLTQALRSKQQKDSGF